MGGGAVIVREATDADLEPLLALCKREWTRLGTPYTIDIDRLRRFQEQRFRIMVLYDGKEMVAAIMAHPRETDRGPGHTVDILVVLHKRPDRMALMDAISMYACNIAVSESRRVVFSVWRKTTPGVRYGRDLLDFDTDDQLGDVQQTGDAQAVIANILSRHPEWSLP